MGSIATFPIGEPANAARFLGPGPSLSNNTLKHLLVSFSTDGTDPVATGALNEQSSSAFTFVGRSIPLDFGIQLIPL